MTITKGLLTYEAEGSEGGPYHSRKLHVPSLNSGLTIGRGYDMKEKSRQKIKQELIKSGLNQETATTLSTASGLHGQSAEQFVQDHQLTKVEISIECQEKLFKLSYQEMENDVKRICNKEDCIAAYGIVNWHELNAAMKAVVIDLRFRGDYTSACRKSLQPILASNDLTAFTANLKSRVLWRQVPEDRFKRRIFFLLDELIKQKELSAI
ncbi:MAG: calcium-binding protein [Colwellia sp.]|nr:calcium-binding protein [Colwellia sp.]